MQRRGGSDNVLIIELNEFNVPLLTAATKQYALPHLAKVLSFPCTQYKTDDRYHSGFLEPWVQWVSIHAGTPSHLHGIKHLGDVPDLAFAQCWEKLSQYNISSGVWGVMNGAKRHASKVDFFLPDPWTFSEPGFPLELNNLLDLPRYLSKNYQNLKLTFMLKKAVKLLQFIYASKVGGKIFIEALKLLPSLLRFGKKHFVFISYFDLISTLLFIEYKKKYNPQCCFLFLNSLAHLQHHHWRAEKVSPEILFGLQYIDKLLAHLFAAFPNDAIIVHNGLSQMNTNHEKPWVLYRQKDPISFFQALNLKAIKIEQHMTHDGHAFFDSPKDCHDAYQRLTSITLENQPLFHIEKNPHDETKLFYMLKFTDKLEDKNVSFHFEGKAYPFFEYFDRIVTRTGRHTPIGTIYSNKIKFSDNIYNHEFNNYLYEYFAPTPISQKTPESEFEVCNP